MWGRVVVVGRSDVSDAHNMVYPTGDAGRYVYIDSIFQGVGNYKLGRWKALNCAVGKGIVVAHSGLYRSDNPICARSLKISAVHLPVCALPSRGQANSSDLSQRPSRSPAHLQTVRTRKQRFPSTSQCHACTAGRISLKCVLP